MCPYMGSIIMAGYFNCHYYRKTPACMCRYCKIPVGSQSICFTTARLRPVGLQGESVPHSSSLPCETCVTNCMDKSMVYVIKYSSFHAENQVKVKGE